MNPSEMTDEQLNEACAIEVMEWHEGIGALKDEWHGKQGVYIMPKASWNPIHDLNQAWMLTEKILGDSGEVAVSFQRGKYWAKLIRHYKILACPYIGKESLAHALSEACLMAKRGKS